MAYSAILNHMAHHIHDLKKSVNKFAMEKICVNIYLYIYSMCLRSEENMLLRYFWQHLALLDSLNQIWHAFQTGRYVCDKTLYLLCSLFKVQFCIRPVYECDETARASVCFLHRLKLKHFQHWHPLLTAVSYWLRFRYQWLDTTRKSIRREKFRPHLFSTWQIL